MDLGNRIHVSGRTYKDLKDEATEYYYRFEFGVYYTKAIQYDKGKCIYPPLDLT